MENYEDMSLEELRNSFELIKKDYAFLSSQFDLWKGASSGNCSAQTMLAEHKKKQILGKLFDDSHKMAVIYSIILAKEHPEHSRGACEEIESDKADKDALSHEFYDSLGYSLGYVISDIEEIGKALSEMKKVVDVLGSGNPLKEEEHINADKQQ